MPQWGGGRGLQPPRHHTWSRPTAQALCPGLPVPQPDQQTQASAGSDTSPSFHHSGSINGSIGCVLIWRFVEKCIPE